MKITSCDNKKILMGSTLFPWDILHTTDMIKNGKFLSGRIQQYSKELASTLNSLRIPIEEKICEILSVVPGPLKVKSLHEDIILHEDVKVDDILKKSPYSLEITYSLLMIVHEIGSLRFLLEYVLDNTIWLKSDDIWMYFITKQVATRFDEIYDAIKFIEMHFPKADSAQLIADLTNAGLYPIDNDIYNFSHNLRNTLHYNTNSWAIDLSKPFYLQDCFVRQAGVRDRKINFRDVYDRQYLVMTGILVKLQNWVAEKVDVEGKLVY